MSTLNFFDAASVARLGPAAAIRAIEQALRSGVDPAADPARQVVASRSGQLLLMPSEFGASTGVKIATVAPGNAARGLPRVQAVYVLFDAETLTPRAILDGAALTTLRTPAVSVAAIRSVLPRRALQAVVFGRGPQALAHLDTLRAVADLSLVTVVGRHDNARDAGNALQHADVVVCATTARTPVFDSVVLKQDCVVIAVGSHEPDARELDTALMARAQVVVEDIATALRESGEVVQAIDEGAITAADLVPMQAFVTGAIAPATDRPIVFTSSGMAWEDLAVAAAVVDQAANPTRPRWRGRPRPVRRRRG